MKLSSLRSIQVRMVGSRFDLVAIVKNRLPDPEHRFRPASLDFWFERDVLNVPFLSEVATDVVT